jgi:mannose-6-phosphate isomerase-like protein (cupin superfamily)
MSAPVTPPITAASLNTIDPVDAYAPRTPAQRWPTTKYTMEAHATGERFEFVSSFRTPSADPKFRFVWTLAPGKRGPFIHVHEQETEAFAVVSGTLRIWIEDVAKDYGPGECVAIAPNVPHRFLNPGNEPVVVNVSLTGARMEDAFMPVAVAAYGRKPTMKEYMRMTLLLANDAPPSTPLLLWERVLGRLCVAAFTLFGMKPFEPVVGWDAENAEKA